jgi:hypothetical protein
LSANKTNRESGETATRIGLFDVECFPNLVYTWAYYEQNVIKIVRHRMICSFAWKWLGESKVKVLALPDFKTYRRNKFDNRELIEALYALMSEAAIVVGHNIDEFDDKRSRTEMIRRGILPPPPHKSIDTLKVARSKFDFNRNSLGELGEFLGVGAKVKHPGFQMWEDCMAGKPAAWRNMKRYNAGDVSPLLEQVYLRMRPWMTNHPDVNALDQFSGCPACKAPNKRLRLSGWAISGGGRRQRFVCKDCGKWSSGALQKGVWKFR